MEKSLYDTGFLFAVLDEKARTTKNVSRFMQMKPEAAFYLMLSFPNWLI